MSSTRPFLLYTLPFTGGGGHKRNKTPKQKRRRKNKRGRHGVGSIRETHMRNKTTRHIEEKKKSEWRLVDNSERANMCELLRPGKPRTHSFADNAHVQTGLDPGYPEGMGGCAHR
jgi:hypothetical protein